MEKGKFYKGAGSRYYKLLEKGKEIGSSKVLYTFLDLYGDDEPVVLSEVQTRILSLFECPQEEIFLPAKGDEKLINKISNKIGVGYICPFCGGQMVWGSDFMLSDIDCLGGGTDVLYVEVTDNVLKTSLLQNNDEYINGNIMEECDNISKYIQEVSDGNREPATFVKEHKDGIYKYYQANDAVVGYYHCMNCGKKFEISNPLPSEEKNYPFYQ